MASAHDDNSLLSNQATNQFLVFAGVEPKSLIQLPETTN